MPPDEGLPTERSSAPRGGKGRNPAGRQSEQPYLPWPGIATSLLATAWMSLRSTCRTLTKRHSRIQSHFDAKCWRTLTIEGGFAQRGFCWYLAKFIILDCEQGGAICCFCTKLRDSSVSLTATIGFPLCIVAGVSTVPVRRPRRLTNRRWQPNLSATFAAFGIGVATFG